MEVAILGAGVAGVSTAIALAQKGFKVSVFERHKGPAHIGAGIVLWPNAVFVLEQLGVLDAIKAVSGQPDKMQRLSKQNEDLGRIDIGLINNHMGYSSLSILRSDFQDILLARLDLLGIKVQYNHTITKINYHSETITEVCFQNGLTIKPDIVIGADGRMASQAREFVYGDNTANYQGFINWIGVFESEDDTFDEISVSDYWGEGERFGIVPITSRKAYWAGGIHSPEIGLRDPASYRRELLSIFNDWPELVKKMINESFESRINKIYVHDHNPVQSWHKNNLIMIGDAAHAPLPTSGQGACQALEDAWHLVNCLLEFPDDLTQAYSYFTQIRYEKTTNIILAARGLAASLFNPDAEYCRRRNQKSINTDYDAMAAAMSIGWGQGLPMFQ